jgi:hypothetical protein
VKLTAEGAEFAAGPDGRITLKVRDPAGDIHEVEIPAHIVAQTVVAFQRAQIAVLRAGGTFYPDLPTLGVDRVILGHRREGSEVMVSTDQMGWVVLRLLSEEAFHQLQEAVARLPALRAGSKSTN